LAHVCRNDCDDDPAIDNDDERADDNCGNDDGNIPEDSHHRFRCRENLKYHLSQLV
jgi:hypothetical protein